MCASPSAGPCAGPLHPTSPPLPHLKPPVCFGFWNELPPPLPNPSYWLIKSLAYLSQNPVSADLDAHIWQCTLAS